LDSSSIPSNPITDSSAFILSYDQHDQAIIA